MNDLPITFEQSDWEVTFETLATGSRISASRFLALLEGEDETAASDALLDLDEKRIALDISDLPKLPVEGESGARLRFEEKLAAGDNWLGQLEENDVLRLCLEEIAAIPAAGDPNVLAMELAEGKEDAVQNLVCLMLSRVAELSREYVGRGVLLIDLIQAGNLGLMEGLNRYDSGDITAYCDWWIRQYMAGSVVLQAKASGVGQKLRQAMEDYRDMDQKLLTELGRNPTVEEMAEALHMTPQQTVAVAETLENAQLLYRAKGDNEASLEPQEEELAVEDTAYFQMRQRIADLLSALPDEDAKLLTLRYGLEGGVPMKPQQVAIRLGITAEEVTAREAAALMKLRQEQ